METIFASLSIFYGQRGILNLEKKISKSVKQRHAGTAGIPTRAGDAFGVPDQRFPDHLTRFGQRDCFVFDPFVVIEVFSSRLSGTRFKKRHDLI